MEFSPSLLALFVSPCVRKVLPVTSPADYREIRLPKLLTADILSQTGNSLEYFKYTKFRDGRCNGYDDHRNERIKRTKQQKRWEHIR